MFADTLIKPLNPYKTAAKELHLSGKAPLSTFSRFSQMLLDSCGMVDIDLRFHLDGHKRCIIEGSIKTRVQISCQRCLQALPHEICAKVSVALVRGEHQLDHVPSEYEAVQADNEDKFILLPVVEDELILALPIVASHEQGSCKMPDYSQGKPVDENAEGSGESDGSDENPFSVLKNLKFDDHS